MAAMKEKLPLIVVYHADCIDGAGAAWAVSKSDMAANRQVHYAPYEHADYATGEAAIQKNLSREAEVVFVDVAPRRTFMKVLLSDQNVRHVTVLDHHKTAAEKYADFPPSDRLTMNVKPNLPSAAKMVWQHLMPAAPVPDVITMIDKMDGDATGLVSNDDFAAAGLYR
jgi:oligoribonuclease NrnB/cAMP/cGMP phosphodiesterase (DHH superfamily)